MDDGTLTRLADLAVGFGCNLQPGQIVAISGEPGKERLIRALAESAYKRGAKFVDVGWFDPCVKRARIAHAAEDTLDYVPPWFGERILALGELHAARDRALRPRRAGAARGPRPGARRPRPAAVGQGGGQGRQRPHDQLDDRAVPDARVGRARPPGPLAARTRSRSSTSRSCTCCGSTRTTRSRPGASAPTRSSSAAAHAHRARLRRPPLRGAGHRPDGRPAARREVAGRALRDRRRHRAHAEPPDRGGLHLARPAARRRARDAPPSRSC